MSELHEIRTAAWRDVRVGAVLDLAAGGGCYGLPLQVVAVADGAALAKSSDGVYDVIPADEVQDGGWLLVLPAPESSADRTAAAVARAREGWTITASGRRVWPLELSANMVSAADITHALARVCRFGGHCSRFYSVAEHSVRVAVMMPVESALFGLLHDADEAYLCDLPAPLKGAFPDFDVAKARVQETVWRAFGLHRLPIFAAAVEEMHRWDRVLLFDEARELMPGGSGFWPNHPAMSSGQAGFGWPEAVAELHFGTLLSALMKAYSGGGDKAWHAARLKLAAVRASCMPRGSAD